jgi:hypothetical protein
MRKNAVLIGALAAFAALSGPAQAATLVGSFAAALTGVKSSTFGIRPGTVLTSTGAIITDATGDFAGITPGTTFTFSPVTAANDTTVSFTTGFGSFVGTTFNLLTSPAPNATVNFNALGTFTPSGSLSGFMEGLASLTIGFTQTGDLIGGRVQPAISASFTFQSPSGNGDGSGSTVPEPASWALLIAGFGMTGAAMRRRSVRIHAS